MDAKDTDAKEKIRDFYSRLLTKSDAELESGNLPRNEIMEAQKILQKM